MVLLWMHIYDGTEDISSVKILLSTKDILCAK